MEITLDNITDESVEKLGLFTGKWDNFSPVNEEEEITEKPPNGDNDSSIEEKVDDKLKGLDESILGEVDGDDTHLGTISQEDEDAETDSSSSSPNLYSSIAKDLFEEGVLTLDESVISNIDSSEKLYDAFKAQVDSLLDEKQKVINEALNAGIPVDTVKQYENIINNLISITDEQINSEENEELRKNLIYNELITRGFSEERAKKGVKKSLDGGSDIEDAKDALLALTDHYKSEYNEILNEAKNNEKIRLENEKKHIAEMKKRFMDTEEPIQGVKLSKVEREKMYTQATKVVGKTDKGIPYTEIQKYALENPVDYQYFVNLLFYQTNGFKDLKKVINKELNVQNRVTMRNLEKVIKNQRQGDTGLDFGNNTEPASLSGLGLRVKLD